MLSSEHRKLKSMKCYKVTLLFLGAPAEHFVFIDLFSALKFLFKNRHAFEFSLGVTHIVTEEDLQTATKLYDYLNKITYFC